MPVIWVLIVGALLYLALQILKKHHALNNQKQKAEKLQHMASKEAGTPVAIKSTEADTPVVTESTPDKSIEKRPVIDTIAGLPNEAKTELRQLKLTTSEAIGKAPDKTLLAIKGIGPARLKQIRAICTDAKDI